MCARQPVGQVCVRLPALLPISVRTPTQVVRLWVHECERVFGDRMASEEDVARFHKMRLGVTRKQFEEGEGLSMVRGGW